MKKLTQLFLHFPEIGLVGDCFRTCLAMLLCKEKPDDVPHFVQMAGGFNPDNEWRDDIDHIFSKMVREYLAPQNLILVELPMDFENFDEMLKYNSIMNPALAYMVTGTSKNNTNHCIICLGGEVFQDPAIDKSGIIGPASDGHFWMSFLAYQPHLEGKSHA